MQSSQSQCMAISRTDFVTSIGSRRDLLPRSLSRVMGSPAAPRRFSSGDEISGSGSRGRSSLWATKGHSPSRDGVRLGFRACDTGIG